MKKIACKTGGWLIILMLFFSSFAGSEQKRYNNFHPGQLWLDNKGVCLIDDLYSSEWAYVPHFYYNFYIYQYSTSFCASQALSKQVLDKQPGSIDRYLNLLKSGGSDYPINLLKNAGVDMTTSEPFNQTIAVMNDVMDRIEEILGNNL